MTNRYEKEVKEAESVLEDERLTDREISQELISKDNPTENVKPSEIDFLRKKPNLTTQIDFTLLGDLAGLSKEAKAEAAVQLDIINEKQDVRHGLKAMSFLCNKKDS